MKIAYASTYDVNDDSTWSKHQRGTYGSNHFIAKTLENEGFEIDYVAPLKQKYRWLTRIKWLYYQHIAERKYYSWAEPLVNQQYAKQIRQRLQQSSADFILATEGTFHLAYLNCSQPIIFWTDTCVAELIDYYPYLQNLCQETKQNILAYEKQGLDRCSLIVLTSDWGRDRIIEHYHLPPEKVIVLPRGANIELSPRRTLADIEHLIHQRSTTVCRLLFSGVSWERKGGDTAVQVAAWLNQNGVPTELVVLGCQPPLNPMPPFIKVVGYIDKSTATGQQELLDWVASAHFLILPTRGDCTPNVLIEANAFGVPCLTTNITGISTVIRNDVNGRMFPLHAAAAAYGEYIARYRSDRAAYHQLALNAFVEYQTRLNWEVVGKSAKQHFESILAKSKI
ncbi:glycosyltransferase family 4 protein [Oscillatoria sp. CS-180]|uniref:glycosyltransferase family 4 protein n=1 Tax=Oscillatoria sp. CS-180 TaxID=3021720 RepID=UPI00232E1029|nr:glycosyltransferase family 4 protein [Oscillatoria sp. CS-180]MDB9529815.1 glycosyltransferase family 4 protein [Oscillatoria sp. CS-180]